MEKQAMLKKVGVFFLISILALSGCEKSTDTSSTDIESIELTSKQSVVLAQIDTITGNEISYTVVQESTMSDMKNSRQEEASNSEEASEDNNRPSMPQGSGKPQGGTSEKNSNSQSDGKEQVIYTKTDETGTQTIPVGTKVITALGNTTTFSRLASGDVIKMIVEKDADDNQIVVGVWIVA